MDSPRTIIKVKRAAKAYAVKNHLPVPRGFSLAPVRRKPYHNLLREIQKHAWPKLASTGVYDAHLEHLLFPPPPTPTVGARAVPVEGTYLGVHEEPMGSNRGPIVSLFERILGIDGEPWCACFQTFCLRKCGWKRSGWNQAYVPAWVAMAHLGKNGLRVVGKADVKEGTLVTFSWNHDGLANHIGIARGPVNGTTVPTREGNTSDSVADRERDLSDVLCFIEAS